MLGISWKIFKVWGSTPARLPWESVTSILTGAAIQGDEVRVSGKKRDDLQAIIAVLKEEDFNIPLQFVNFRD